MYVGGTGNVNDMQILPNSSKGTPSQMLTDGWVGGQSWEKSCQRSLWTPPV